ncbi:MAG: hypothetical protein AAF196_16315 [Planctomycetota bacterium]
MNGFLNFLGRPKRDGLWIALALLCVYEILRQPLLYGDAYHMVPEAYGNKWEHGQHLLYLPLVQVLRSSVGEWFSLSTFEVMSHLSCLTTALGVWFAHKGFRALGISRVRAALGTALSGAAPGVLFFATLVEIHAPFFATAALAFWAMACLGKRPGFGRALVLGLTTGLSALMHLSGGLMPLPFLLGAWAAGRTGIRDTQEGGDRFDRLPTFVPSLIGASLGHAFVIGLPFLLRELGVDRIALTFNSAETYIRQYAEAPSQHLWSDLTETFLNEWALAFAPLAVAFLCGLESRATRRLTVVTLLSTIPYFIATFAMLRGHPEHGAYFFAFPFLLAWLTVASLPRIASALLLLVALGLGLRDVQDYGDPQRHQAPADQVEALYPDRDCAFLIGGLIDTELWAVDRPDDKALYLPLYIFAGEAAFAGLLPNLDAILTEWFDEGRTVLLSPELIELSQPGRLGLGGSDVLRNVLLPYLRATYDIVDLPSDGYAGWEIRRKP